MAYKNINKYIPFNSIEPYYSLFFTDELKFNIEISLIFKHQQNSFLTHYFKTIYLANLTNTFSKIETEFFLIKYL